MFRIMCWSKSPLQNDQEDLIIPLSLGYFNSKILIGAEFRRYKNSVISVSLKMKFKTRKLPCLQMSPKIENLKLLLF